MTTPNPESDVQGNSDAPWAKVGIGPSEIANGIVILSGLLDSYFGNDWGLSKNSQAFGLLVAGLATLAMTIGRAIKHHAAAHANAATYATQVQAVLASVDPGKGISVSSVAAGLKTLNNAVDVDTIPADLPADQQPPPA